MNYNDLFLQVQYEIESPVIELLMDSYKLDNLKNIYKDNKFYFFKTYTGSILKDMLTMNKKIDISIDTSKINENNIDDVIVGIQNLIISNNETKYKTDINTDIVLQQGLREFFRFVIQNKKFGRLVVLTNLENKLVSNIKIKKYVVNKEQSKTDKFLKKALYKAQTEYEKYKDNPEISLKLLKEINRIKEKLYTT